ncbi:cation-translocating P-type ATPase [Streptomyces sp. TS71-3]|uniref:cation-translocating P-type ATPase n=1 Tax=Streptomyces sp. TS71-3 TaxID=2733862 RepID=UPI001B2D7CD8|nr:cation-translocating P-type ATPase [Streptomyces sp. TS71-3]GHJ37982.1 haloacid dehalogenase [Streptomyces sp. TS71-3]
MKVPGIGVLNGLLTGAARNARPPAATAGSAATARSRVLSFTGGRLHILVRGLRGPRARGIAKELERRLAAHPAVEWAAVNGVLQAVVIATGGGAEEEADLLEELLAVVEDVEHAHEAGGEPLPAGHPGAPRPAGKIVWSLAFQAAALPVAAAGRLVRFVPLPYEVAAVISEIDYEPRLRRLADAALGRDNAGVVLAALNAVFQAGAGGILGLTVDAARHGLLVAEMRSARAAWHEAEPGMAGTRERAAAGALPEVPPRVTPLRNGPVERYTARSAHVAGASFAGVLGVRRRPRAAVAAALATIPKAPVLAREAFVCILGGALNTRGTPVHAPGSLRLLDRIGTLVLDTGGLSEGTYRLADLVPLDKDAQAGKLAATGHRLFDPGDPDRLATARGWRLGPLEDLRVRGRTGRRAAAALAEQDARLLGLAEGDRLMAVIKAVPEVPDAARLLVAAAHRSRLRVVARGPRAGAVVPDADEIAPDGEEAVATVRRLQAGGRGVLLVSADRAALACADIGVGVARADGVPAWGAHVYALSATAALPLAEACGPARTVSRRGVRLAQAAAGAGAVTALTGPDRRPAVRSMAAVNGAAALGMVYGAWSAVRLLRRPPDPVPAREPWHAMPVDTVLARTGSRPEGLADAEAARRAAPGQVGPRQPSLIRSVAIELANPLTPVLLGGGVLSAAVGGVVDAAIVVGVTVLSGVVGGVQRHLTEREVRRLHEGAETTAFVVRDGRKRRIPAGELVVGDIVHLSGGDVVPADCRLTDGEGLEVDESALTGESMPVAKSPDPVLAADVADRTCMVYEGTTLATGHGTAVVVATGTDTEAGQSALTARGASPAVGVERRLARITRTALPVALGSAGAVMAAGLLHRHPLRDSIGAGVALAVASVPEGLPFLVSAAQLAASRRLAAQGVLVRDPRTIEAAGRADVLCFDKTGTLTRGRIELSGVDAGGAERPLGRLASAQRAVLAAGLRATPRARADRPQEHVTDRAVTEGGRRAGVRASEGASHWRPDAHLAFEPSRGYHATRGRAGRIRMLSVKGAPEEVVQRCATHRGRRVDAAELLARADKLASAGYRVLAVAERRDAAGGELDDDAVAGLDFLGFLLLSEEVRSDAARSVRQLADAGVQIVMITGDHPQTAEAIARELKVLDGHRVVTGAELDELDDGALDALLPSVGVVARGTPAHKVRVVQGFQRLGRTVAMTGDGSNDAPAIRLADVGIALGRRGTPAARAAADLVVTDDRLETILAALVEGRAMWASVRRALAILVGGNFGEIGFTLLGSALSGSSPLTARQLLLVNLFTDLAPAIAVALRRPAASTEERLLEEGPEASLGAALTREMTVRAVTTAAGAGAAWMAGRVTGRPARARTIALAALVGAQLGQTLVAGRGSPLVVGCVAASALTLVGIVQTPGVSHFFGCVPLGPVAWSTAVACAAVATAASVLFSPATGGPGRTEPAPSRTAAGERAPDRGAARTAEPSLG